MGKVLSPVFVELTALRNSWVRVLSEGEHGCAAAEGGPCGTQLSPSPRVLGEMGETWVWMCPPLPPQRGSGARGGEFKGNMGGEGSQRGDPRKESCHRGHRSISAGGRPSVPLRGLRPEGRSGSVAARRPGPARASGVWPVSGRKAQKRTAWHCLSKGEPAVGRVV